MSGHATTSLAPPTVDGWRLRMLLKLMHVMSVLRLPGTNGRAFEVPAEKRAALKPAPWMLLPMPAVVIERGSIMGRSGEIPIKRFLPRQSEPRSPRILFIHGGGWIVGGVDSLDYLCTNLCDALNAEVTAVGYRLAPEHPYPAGLDDCEDAVLALAKDHSPISVVGDSAGGNLAAAVCLRLRGTGAIRKQVLIYPALDLTMQSPSLRPDRDGFIWRDMLRIIDAYRGAAGADEPLISPLLAPDLSGLPPALVITANADPLRDDGLRYAQRLGGAGVPVRLENYLGMPHAFLSIASLCPAAPAAIRIIVEELRE